MKSNGKIRKFFTSMTFNLTATSVVVLLLLCVVACLIGYYQFTDSLTAQYNDAAYHTALTAAALVDADQIDHYLEVRGEDAEYQLTLSRLNLLADKQNTSVIYVIKPTPDYQQYVSVFNSPSSDSGYTAWEIGKVVNTANQQYVDYYRDMFENGLQTAFVVRDQGLNGANPHITTMVALTRSDGSVAGIMCVQRFMAELNAGRRRYTMLVFSIVMGLTILLAVITFIWSRTQFVRPLHRIINETKRFGADGSADATALDGRVSTVSEIAFLAHEVGSMEHQIVDYTRSLTQATADKERILTELSVASQIQSGVIPTDFPADPRFDLYAMMKPAKEVGGDFYDFVMVDDDHLALIVGDVSGKGVPAALFMMIVSILTKESALLGGSPAQILEFVNRRICENNNAEMFVTMWLGILQLSTGKLVGVNAGHDDPIYQSNGGDFALRKEKHGLVVGAMLGARYREFEWQMQPGDKLIVYTDGLPEASDADKRMYRFEGAIDSFNRRKEQSPQDILQGTWQDVCDFVGDAPQFDDLTMLCLRYNGVDNDNSIRVQACDDNLGQVLDFVSARLQFDAGTTKKLCLAVEEIYANIAHYAYPQGQGQVTVSVTDLGTGVRIAFVDSGVPYNPLSQDDPDITLSAAERQIGGLGVFLAKKIADRIYYENTDGQNCLTMEKDYVKPQ